VRNPNAIRGVVDRFTKLKEEQAVHLRYSGVGAINDADAEELEDIEDSDELGDVDDEDEDGDEI
jgi:hypothetical protein